MDLNRLRLKLAAQLLPPLRIDLEYDNEVLLGSYLRTSQFAILGERVPDTMLDLDRTYATGRSVLARHRLYRGAATWSTGESDITIGRQRIAWGNGRFWSPLDVLNPFDAIRIERDERDGIDALLVSRQPGPLAQLSAVAAPSTDRSPPVLAGYVRWNAGGADYSLAGGRVRGVDFVGADVTGRVGGVGLRSEVSASRARAGRSFMQILLGADYGFANTLTVSGEAYFNGLGANDPSQYDIEELLAGRIRSLARRYGALAVTYDVTPLLQLVAFGVVNLDDHSGVVWPGLEYSLAGNFYVSAGVQAFLGDGESEYGRIRNVLHVQVKAFF